MIKVGIVGLGAMGRHHARLYSQLDCELVGVADINPERAKEIGEKYGPFDFAMLECGQYNERWKEIHMMPEQTAQAGVDIQAKVIMPIHWAAFSLAMHSWTDPVERVLKKAEELKLPVLVPKIGSFIQMDGKLQTREKWWVEPK